MTTALHKKGGAAANKCAACRINVQQAIRLRPTRMTPHTLEGVAYGRTVTASLTLRVARLVGVMVDDLLVGKFLPPGACPNCGHVITSDFNDENTVVEAALRQPTAGLALVK